MPSSDTSAPSSVLRPLSSGSRPPSSVLRLLSSVLCLFLTVLCLSFPIRDLIADHHYRSVARILDDPATEDLDVMPINESSMPAYHSAITALQQAAAFAPACARYPKALSELYNRLGKWADIMQTLNAPLPPDAVPSADAYDKALSHLKEAVSLEPAQPDTHLALGLLYDTLDDPGPAALELQKASDAYPANAPLHYSLALHYLNTGRTGDALEQSRILAKYDDSYILYDSPEKQTTLDQQPLGYITFVKQSYLFGALEIAWRASHDLEVVKGIAPNTPDAKPVLQLFQDNKQQ